MTYGFPMRPPLEKEKEEEERLLVVDGSRLSEFSGRLRLPPSKSYLHRALCVAAITEGTSEITNAGTVLPEDVEATLRFLSSMGIGTTFSRKEHGTLVVTSDGRFRTRKRVNEVYVGGSGTTARFALSLAVLAQAGARTRIVGDESLSKRPMGTIISALRQLGVNCEYEGEEGFLPLAVEGGGLGGGDRKCKVDGSISSQFLSSLLIACTKSAGRCEIALEAPGKLVSKEYIGATLCVLSSFGYGIKSRGRGYDRFWIEGNQKGRPASFRTPGDMSSAAAIVGATIAAQGRIVLENLDPVLPQADSAILGIASSLFGAKVKKWGKGGALSIESGPGRRKRRRRNAIAKVSLRDSPDLVPVVAALSAARGPGVKVEDIGHLRFKESDRISSIAGAFSRLGIPVREGRTFMTIPYLDERREQEPPPKGKQHAIIVLDSANDHRIFMALTVLALSDRFGGGAGQKIAISNPECIGKSYPGFIRDLRKLCHPSTTLKVVKESAGL